MFKAFFIALQFLTRLPLPGKLLAESDYNDQRLGLSVVMYPLVGLLIGGILIGMLYLLGLLEKEVSPLVQAGFVLLCWVVITGALHLDGLSDSADAWVGGYGDKQRTLAIMKDPYCGPAGVSILVVVLIAKFALLSSVVQQSWVNVLFAPVLARSAVIILFMSTTYVRADGIGAAHAAKMPRIGAGLMLLLVMLAGAYFLQVSFGWIMLACVIAFLLLRSLMVKRLGGTTGDTAGAMIELLELTVLCVLVVI